jgi:hypothetical protein
MDPDQPAHPRSLTRIHAVRLQTLFQVEKLIANIMDPDQTARMCRLVWIHAYVGFVMTRLKCVLHVISVLHVLNPVFKLFAISAERKKFNVPLIILTYIDASTLDN